MSSSGIKIPEKCVLWLDFTDDTGNIIWDKSGNANNSDLFNAEMYRELPIKGRYFNGINAYAEIADLSNWITVDFTLCMVTRLMYPYHTGTAAMVAIVNLNPFIRPHIGKYYPYIDLRVKIGGTMYATDIYFMEEGWNIIWFRRTSGKLEIWDESKIVVKRSVPRKPIDPNPTKPYTIMWDSAAADRFSVGFLCHFSAYNTALEGDQIERLSRDLVKYKLRRIIAAADVRVR